MDLLQEVEKLYSIAKLLKEQTPLLRCVTFDIPDVPLEDLKAANIPDDMLRVGSGTITAQFANYDSVPGFYMNVFAYSVPINIESGNSILESLLASNLITE